MTESLSDDFMQKPLLERLPLVRPKTSLPRVSFSTPFQHVIRPGFDFQGDRILSHLIILGILLILVALGGVKLSQQALSAPQYSPPKLLPEVDVVSNNGQPLTLPDRLNNRTGVLLPQLVPHTIIPDRTILEPKIDTIQTYIVQPGDTIFGIALAFGLAPETILWANSVLEDNPDLLRLEQELIILPVNGVYHQVGGGDTLEAIAATFKVEPQAIINYHLNELDLENPVIVPGQWLIVPGGLKPYVPKIVSSVAVNAPDGVLAGSGIFQWAASGTVTQDFWSGHRALDIGGWDGAPIFAADAGYVVAAQWDDTGYGRLVMIDHGNGFKTLYAHMSVYYVSVGEEVVQGQQIGEMGSTGNSTGPHLHFEILLDEVKRNPWGFLP